MQKNPRLSAIIDHLLRQSTGIVSVHVAVGESILLSDEQIHVQWDECPPCGSAGAKIITGEEFFLESIEAQNE
jgi:Zn finger protein HypA/HybF involved in hydrogenase expression